MQHKYHYPSPPRPTQFIRFITKYINPLNIVNIPPYHPPGTITKVSTTDINRIHDMGKHTNNIIMGMTSTCSNTAYPRTNTKSNMVTHLQRSQLYHLMMMVFCLQVFQNDINCTCLTQATIQHHNRNEILYLMNTTPHLQYFHPILHSD